MPTTSVLTVARDRSSKRLKSGIRVHAKCGDQMGSFNIETLDRDSLIRWLRSDGGKNDLAENVVLALLGHLTDESKLITGGLPIIRDQH